MSKLMLMIAEAIAVAILAIVSVSYFGWEDGARTTISFFIAYLVPRIILTRSKGFSVTAGFILLAVAALCVSFDIFRMVLWIRLEDYSLAFPNIGGDGRNYYKYALAMYNGKGIEMYRLASFPGYSAIIVGLWKVLGVSVIWPVALSLMFTLTAVVLTGLTTRRLLTGRVTMSAPALVATGMGLCALLFHYLVIGTCVLKEGPIFIAISMTGFALAEMAAVDEERHMLWRDILLLVLAAVIMAVVRTSYIYFIMVGVVLMALPNWRRDWLLALGIMAVLVALLFAGRYLSLYSVERHSDVVNGGWNMNRFYINSAAQQPYKSLLGYYFLYSPLHRMFMLPLTVTAQSLLPLPWVNPLSVKFFNFFSRLTWGWYLIGGITSFYYVVISWRKHDNMGAWPWWPAVVFDAIAYVMAGSVVRYVLPIQPLYIPVAVYVLAKLREGRWRKSFSIWTVVFIILLIAALIISFKLKQGFFDPWLPDPPITE